MTSQRGGVTHGAPIKAGRRRGLAERRAKKSRWWFCRGCCRFCFSSPPLWLPFWQPTHILPTPGLWPIQSTPRTCSRPLSLRSMGLRVRSPARGAWRTCSRGQSWPDPHWLRTLQRSAPETRLASRSALSKGWPPTPLGRSSTLEQRRTTGPGVVATRSGKQLNLEGQCRWRRADYYTGRPKAESPLSQGPRPVL